MADRITGLLRRQRRVGPVEAVGFEDRAAVLVVSGAAVALVIAELALLAGGLVAGSIAWSAALVVLLLLALSRLDRPEGRLSLALAVVPVLRLASIALPAVILPTSAWYVLIGIPVFLAIALAARVLGLRPAQLGLRPAATREVAALAAAGVPLGLAAYLIADMETLPIGASAWDVVLVAVAVVGFGAFLEELLLRGLVQRVAAELFEDGGVVASVALTGLLYASSLNLRYIVLMVAVAALFSVMVRRSRSIAATTAGHATLLLAQAVLGPWVFG